MSIKSFVAYAPTLAIPLRLDDRILGMSDAVEYIREMAIITKDTVEARRLMVVARRVQDEMERRMVSVNPSDKNEKI